jgi:class 3 adenylate cyclase
VLTTILKIEPAVHARDDVLAHRGRLIDCGEAFLATFDAPGHAIRCADAIRTASTGADITPHAGVHTGEVELRGGVIAGLSVDIAAAIAALARPGEILVSRTVTDLVIGSGISFADRGIHGLSGIPDRWPLFAVTAV